MANFHLQIVTPDRLVFDGQAEKIILRTVGGDACILARHIDYAAPLGIGVAKVTDDQGNTRQAACNGGMLSVSNGEVRVLATTFEWEDEIDLTRAENARDEAQQELEKMQKGDHDFACVEAKLKRALTRIQTKG
ncbi:MAG: ATP synthase F1 subunit epsilon [Clostridia bacterium]|nr:ATP synthase F1 subunit epsilon [Clostridia bacterium]